MQRPSLVLTLLLAACTVEDLQYQDRYCASNYPCPGGYSCVENQCKSHGSTADLPVTPGDSQPDAPLSDLDRRDAPLPDLAEAGGTDLFVWDTSWPDLMPAPDGGCPSGLTNCGGACVDTQSSFPHCGGCFQSCPAGSADRCENGTCYCGNQGPTCTSGLNCVTGACSCLVGAGSLCQGCCKSGLCYAGNTASTCGLGAVACQVCQVASGLCQVPSCPSGACTQTSAPDGSVCSNGHCYSGACCTGCWNGSACLAGTAASACGVSGLGCKTCSGITPKCSSGSCVPLIP